MQYLYNPANSQEDTGLNAAETSADPSNRYMGKNLFVSLKPLVIEGTEYYRLHGKLEIRTKAIKNLTISSSRMSILFLAWHPSAELRRYGSEWRTE
ncbi:MAG: hypothetical protein KAR40_18270 [Candidatus Sabulitectum sp.]|nr:hypothetical protein [Candidatus Sabulitectum sp.]